ncbi:MAG: YggS family pyridoxal phosphate-dependent enzyme [Acidobacteriota bacterium]
MLPAEVIAANLYAVEQRIAAACQRAGRARSEVTLVAVSKTFPAEAVTAAFTAGVTDVGENRVQETRDKQPLVSGRGRWHLIGHLQSNKAKDAVRLFDMIQTVDSFALAEKIGRAAESEGKVQDVLVQVNIGRETQKSGAGIDELPDLVDAVKAIAGVRLCGLMAIPPVGLPAEVRGYFRDLRTLRDGLRLEHLSMGMSEDFEAAIEEGSTMVRIGRAIFGSRG